MTNKEHITLRELATHFKMSPSAIYNYIKKGLLPRPNRIPNTDKGRGTLAIYPKSIIKQVEKIKKWLEHTHSLDRVAKELPLSKAEKQELIDGKLKKLQHLNREGKYDTKEFVATYRAIESLRLASASTGMSITLSESKILTDL